MKLYQKVIKHERFLDVAFFVQQETMYGSIHFLTGRWLNQGFVNSWTLGDGHLSIQGDKLSEWLYIDEPYDFKSCLRYKNWIKINE